VILYLSFIKKGKKISLHYWKYALTISLPYIPHKLSLTIISVSGKILITNFAGAEYNAIYSLAYSIGAIVLIFSTSLNTALSPWIGEQLNKNKTKHLYVLTPFYVLFISIIVLGTLLIAPEVLFFLGGQKYLIALNVITPIIFSVLLEHTYTIYVNTEQYTKKTIHMAIGSILTAILNLILNLLFIPKFGYIAAGYTTLVSYFFLLIFHYTIVKKMDYTKFYNNTSIFIIVSATFISSLLINVLYQFQLLRYIILSIFTLSIITIFIANYKNIKNFLK
jgi:O-antigen/teichoic acid export membrane protein